MTNLTTVTTESPASLLQRQQASLQSQADAALASLAERLGALLLEANELSKCDKLFAKPVAQNLEKFVSFGASANHVFKAHVVSTNPQLQAQAA